MSASNPLIFSWTPTVSAIAFVAVMLTPLSGTAKNFMVSSYDGESSLSLHQAYLPTPLEEGNYTWTATIYGVSGNIYASGSSRTLSANILIAIQPALGATLSMPSVLVSGSVLPWSAHKEMRGRKLYGFCVRHGSIESSASYTAPISSRDGRGKAFLA